MANPTELRRSPLHHLASDLAAASGAAVAVRELPHLAMVAVRCEATGAAADAVHAAWGIRLPDRCGGVASAGDLHAIWMGPDEWLVVSESASPEGLVAPLAAASGAEAPVVVDVSSNRTVIEVSGPRAAHLLAKGCALDLHPREFRPSTAVPTDLAGVQVVLWHVDDDTWRVLPRSSFAEHLVRWMGINMTEYPTART